MFQTERFYQTYEQTGEKILEMIYIYNLKRGSTEIAGWAKFVFSQQHFRVLADLWGTSFGLAKLHVPR